MVTHLQAAVLLGALTLASCKSDSSFKAGVATETPVAAQLPEVTPVVDEANSRGETPAAFDELGSLTDKFKVSLKVDVVFAIDTSASMDDELIATQNNLQKLITTLNDGKLDSRIHLLVEQPLTLPAGTDPNKVARIEQRVDSADAISRLNALFTGLYAANYLTIDNLPMATPMPFRKDANLEVVVITDDNGSGEGNLAVDFDPTKTLKATFNGIIGLPTSVASDTCQVANVGNEYITLATQSKGSTLDICSADWSGLITRLSNDMVKRSVTFSLGKKPVNPKNILVTLDKQKMASTDWAYDDKTNAVTLVKTTAVKDGSELTLNYNPAM
ncbi:MAG TPA: hypothetical protein VE954_17480 [Oligoflexus sp.]|uniref:hypothetical protein n=1 Tax=Oligoflexus sp. TaxID=1971216 RepID=UPI002D499522|nr:hypothetical protein [Oligoflexus sp.]HYX34892.1 hypothetical protein [Oligoflexus sp.]